MRGRRQALLRREVLRRELLRGCLLTFAVCTLVLITGLAALRAVPGKQTPIVTVPNLIGLDEAAARKKAESVGLQVEVGGERYDEEIPEGKVCKMEPGPGRRVRMGRKILLLLSKGPRDAEVPNLIGKDLEAARILLAKARLVAGEIVYKRSSKPKDTVIGQAITPGARLPPGSKVDLYVSGGPEFGYLRLPDGTVKVFRTVVIRVPDDGDYHHVTVEVKHRRNVETIYDRIQPPGERVEVDVMAERGDKLRVLIDDEQIVERKL